MENETEKIAPCSDWEHVQGEHLGTVWGAGGFNRYVCEVCGCEYHVGDGGYFRETVVRED